MKKILLALTVGFTSIAALSNCAHAQNAVYPVAFNDTKHFRESVRLIAALENPADLGTYIPDAKTVNTKAIKDFHGRFSTVDNAQWFSDKNGYVSYFVKDGYGDRVFYDAKGHWAYSLIFEGEDKLPRDLRAAVKSTYFDMAITLVEEVQTPECTLFVVHLEDKTSIKILEINNEGEMKSMQDFSK